jgi:hypothetical protein
LAKGAGVHQSAFGKLVTPLPAHRSHAIIPFTARRVAQQAVLLKARSTGGNGGSNTSAVAVFPTNLRGARGVFVEIKLLLLSSSGCHCGSNKESGNFHGTRGMCERGEGNVMIPSVSFREFKIEEGDFFFSLDIKNLKPVFYVF